MTPLRVATGAAKPTGAMNSLVVVERMSGREIGADGQVLLATLADDARLTVKTLLRRTHMMTTRT